jgi:alkyl hydroperoxide reductase subunit AhpC
MVIRIGDDAPYFTIDTTEGQISLRNGIGDRRAVHFSHPGDFTPVMSDEGATRKDPQRVTSLKRYPRMVPQPKRASA